MYHSSLVSSTSRLVQWDTDVSRLESTISTTISYVYRKCNEKLSKVLAIRQAIVHFVDAKINRQAPFWWAQEYHDIKLEKIRVVIGHQAFMFDRLPYFKRRPLLVNL